ncbi:response regulator [Winogradskyella thalassocola]|uniref:DNA-binding response regulator, NarL/FixJ family, contains REC and HTH domains n=1 Tax=Winogradskyella thalassocola TaxID=262004 RepID=A0A1G8K492_9FLAO|nr:response regulator transcription factor [Winogradskyella thalassocola]SDI38231.1 DNA-binding response regulator, NarL/FixJ family, contains REC and HTH domains [Winogradskyella thalassocola]
MIHILIVDSHPIVRTGLELFLNSKADFKVIGSLGSGIEIFEFVRRHKVDVIISEVDLPELNGITAMRAIKKENKSVQVLMFSNQPEEIYAISTIKAGASGYLNKGASVDELETAIRKISAGETSLSEKMDKHFRYEDTRKSRSRMFKKLSTREIEVLKLLSIGRKNKEIAQELDINEKTVSTYKARLFKKLNVTNIVDLIHQAKHHNLT